MTISTLIFAGVGWVGTAQLMGFMVMVLTMANGVLDLLSWLVRRDREAGKLVPLRIVVCLTVPLLIILVGYIWESWIEPLLRN
jgi:hypothetical protein